MKTIYYAFMQKIEVSDDLPEESIDDLIFQQLVAQVKEPADYMWSERPDLFDFG